MNPAIVTAAAIPLAIIPRPLSLVETGGVLKLSARDTVKVVQACKAWDARGFAKLSAPANPGDEAYRLEIGPRSIRIGARSQAGRFRALATLRQILPAVPGKGGISLPCVRIEDAPRFGWRGFLLDCGRHYMPVPFIKRVIDLMALYKFNRFHWHLTEDQGWRLEIRRHPPLTRIGAWRTQVNPEGPVKRYGGFYTQAEAREIVRYASARGIVVVPEIELPGHCQAALAAYPALSCTGGPFTVSNEWGIHKDVYCAGNDKTFSLLEDVLTEVVKVFPGPFIHLGADEVPKDRWKACPKCQARIKAEGLADENALQTWFVNRVIRFLATKNRRAICWDEILEGGAPADVIVQVWRADQKAVSQAARAGHDVIHSPYSHTYLNYGLAGYWMDLKWVHGWEPAVEGDPPEKAARIGAAEAERLLGGEACLWTEGVEEPGVFPQILPRILPVAENLWSPEAGKQWEEFSGRAEAHRARLEAQGISVGASVYTEPVKE